MKFSAKFIPICISFCIMFGVSHAQNSNLTIADSLKSLEKYLGVTFETTAEEDGGVRMVNPSNETKIKGEVISPNGKIITWVSTQNSVAGFKKSGIRVKNTTELTRAVFALKQKGSERACFMTEKGKAQRVWFADITGLTITESGTIVTQPVPVPLPQNTTTTTTPTDTASKTTTNNSTTLKPYTEIQIGATIRNSYNIGNLNIWFSERAGTTGIKIDEGPTSFFYIGFAHLIPMKPSQEKSVYFGLGMSITKPPSHSILEHNNIVSSGISTSIYLNPYIGSVSLPVKLPLAKKISVLIDPAFLIGFTKGLYMEGLDSYRFSNSYGFGFGISAGAEMVFGKRFGINFKMTSRILKANLLFDDATSAAVGFNQPELNNGEKLQVDLGGLAITGGITFRFGKK